MSWPLYFIFCFQWSALLFEKGDLRNKIQQNINFGKLHYQSFIAADICGLLENLYIRFLPLIDIENVPLDGEEQ